MKKKIKPIWIVLLAIDLCITVTLFVISILMLNDMPSASQLTTNKRNYESGIYVPKGLIEYLRVNTTLYLLAGVLPLVLLLIVNIVVLMTYVKKISDKKKVELNELTDEQKEALRKELLKDLSNQSNENNK